MDSSKVFVLVWVRFWCGVLMGLFRWCQVWHSLVQFCCPLWVSGVLRVAHLWAVRHPSPPGWLFP